MGCLGIRALRFVRFRTSGENSSELYKVRRVHGDVGVSKIRVPFWGVLIIRILLFSVLC